MKQHAQPTNGVSSVIGSPMAGLLFLGLALYAQTPHTQNAFFELGHDKASDFALYNSWAYAIALELAVLYFVVRGNFQPSYIFAGVSVAMNVAYYTIHQNDMTNIAQNWPNWLVSVSLPVAIAYYSHCIAGADSPSIRAWLIAQWRRVQLRINALRKRQIVQTEPHVVAQSEPPLVQPVPAHDAHLPIADDTQMARQMKEEGYTIAQIAKHFKVHRNTASKMVNSTNGHKEPAQ